MHKGRKLGGGFAGGCLRLVVTALIFARGGVNPIGCFRLVEKNFRALRALKITQNFFARANRVLLTGLLRGGLTIRLVNHPQKIRLVLPKI